MQGHRRTSIRRRLISVLTGATMLMSVHAVFLAPTAAAYTLPSSCNWGDKAEYITTSKKPWLITHARVVLIPESLVFHSTVSETTVNSVTAGVSGTVSGTSEAGVILAKASLTVSLTLKAEFSSTQTTTHTDTWDLGPFTNDRTYVLFTATHRASGNYDYYQCTRFDTWGPKITGTWVSWDVEAEGAANCAASYPTSDMRNTAKAFCP